MPGRCRCALLVLSLLLLAGCVTPPAPRTSASTGGGTPGGGPWPEWTPLSLSLLESREGGTVIVDSVRFRVPREPAAASRPPPPLSPPDSVTPSPGAPGRDGRDVEEIEAGKSVAFRVSAEGAPPLSFQWRKNGQPIAGATNEHFRIERVGERDAGTYDCVASNSFGSATSRPLRLVVRQP